MQCGSWPYSYSLPSSLGGAKSIATPRFSGAQLSPRSVDSNVPPPDIDRYRCAGSRGSTRIECSLPPSGVSSLSLPTHRCCSGWSLKPATGAHVTPPSSLRNSPLGDVPAYHVPGSLACPGVNQNTWSTARPRGSPLTNCGGVAASFHVSPPSLLRNSVGPRCPCRDAHISVLRSRGSSTMWWHSCPRNVGPRSDQAARSSVLAIQNPLRVAMYSWSVMATASLPTNSRRSTSANQPAA